MRHPEQKNDEVFLLNIREDELKQYEKTAPKKFLPLRMGTVAYQTNSLIVVPEYRPLFGKGK
jgi:hypothetical protein